MAPPPRSIDTETSDSVFKQEDEFFKFQDGGWAYVIYHTHHFGMETSFFKAYNLAVGNILLAIDNERNIYISKEHVCGEFYNDFMPTLDDTNGVLVVCEATNQLANIDHFLSSWNWKKTKKY